MENFKLPIMSVHELNILIKDLVENIPAFSSVYITGEISNFTAHRSGHYYLTLKDDKAVVKAVMFRTQVSRLKFVPENGMKVLVKARVGVYERDGVYQLYLDDIQPQGVGALSVAFEQLKSKLEKQGLFSPDRKKSLPKYPKRIGVITSPTGAAIRDIRNVLGRRYPIAEIVFRGVSVQGDGAAKELKSALVELDSLGDIDVIIIGRGGGSIEDLWAFNDEALALAIATAKTPIISGVGHETDFTIADFVADCRAPTPSAAAELAVPDLLELRRNIAVTKARLNTLLGSILTSERDKLELLKTRKCLKSANFILDSEYQRLDSNSQKLTLAIQTLLDLQREKFASKCALLQSLSPLAILSRGYSVVSVQSGVLKSVNSVDIGEAVSVLLQDGTLECEVKERCCKSE